ncbi:uncharacterized protein LOC143194721 [Rhynchophorus ferrugineus]|uniref:uncharacterized protein LOC143194721 n=1 Tax=Rhynchophorus ferrugineus TaxID=354439 RepID=UPI003FCDE75E
MIRAVVAAFITCAVMMVIAEDPDPFFLTAAKSVPRIGRSPNRNPSLDFEKFFLKASKSVPRIGRGNDVPFPNDQDIWDSPVAYRTWGDIANLYEYHPELFTNSDLGAQDLLSDRVSEGGRFKRSAPTKSKTT